MSCTGAASQYEVAHLPLKGEKHFVLENVMGDISRTKASPWYEVVKGVESVIFLGTCRVKKIAVEDLVSRLDHDTQGLGPH